MKRVLVLLAVIFSVAAAHAQTEAQQWMKSALETLKTAGNVGIRLQGTEATQDKTTDLLTDLWFSYTFDDQGQLHAKLDCRDYRNSVLVRRIVGDGDVLWTHDPIRNEYSATTYGSLGGARPADYLKKLLLGFQAKAQGNTLWLARLLLDVWGQDAPRVVSWVPEGTEALGLGAVVYQAKPPSTRTSSFGISGDLDAAELDSITFADTVTVGGVPRTTNWVAGVTMAPVVTPDVFAFKPPANARPVSLPTSRR